MPSTESFDELEQQLSERIAGALREIREEFRERIESATGRLEEMVGSEIASARHAAEAAAGVEAEEARAALLAEAEEAKVAAIAEALAVKEAEVHELLQGKDAALAALEQERDEAWTEAQRARDEVQTAREEAFAGAEEAKAKAVAEAVEAKEVELNELLAERDARFAELEASSEEAVAQVRAEMETSLEAARAAAEDTLSGAITAAIIGLHERIGEIDEGRSQNEILEALLTSAARYASRGLLFLTREDGLQGWGGAGFATEEGRLQEIHLDYEEGTAWAELAKGRGTVELSADVCAELCRPLDGSEPLEGVLIPIVLRDRLAAALYADRSSDADDLQIPILQLLSYVAGLALDTQPMRQRRATPTLRFVADAPADDPGLDLWQFLTPEEPIEEPAPVPEVPPEDETLAEEPMLEEELAVEVDSEAHAFEEPAATAEYVAAEESGFTVEDETPLEAPMTEPVAPPAPEPEPPVEVTAQATTSAAVGAEVSPPEDVEGPGWAFTTRRFGEASDEDAGHEEARRLARLLVTEIKLYNEEQVEEGRRGRNIYHALREDIDRSRQIYEERIDESVRSSSDYFREELVRILAGGDEDVMGI